jgi:xylulokinase
MISTGVLGSPRKTSVSPTPPLSGRSSNGLSSLGVPFDPYDYAPLPSRILATGAAANFPSVSNLVGDVFNAPVFVPLSQVDSAQVVPHRNAPAQGYPSRASLGAAYVARWVWGREWGSGGLGVFEDEVKRLLGKRWVATGGTLLRTNVNGATSTIGFGALGGGSGGNSGASTPYGHPGGRLALGNTVFAEEDEDEALEMERNGRFGGLGGSVNPGVIGSGVYGISGSGSGGAYGESTMRLRTQTGSTTDTLSSNTSSGIAPSTALTTPDIGSLGQHSNSTNGSAGTPSIPTPLTPVVALATSDAEAQIGLAKVAEPDVDAFLAYASIVPEYYRLEGMLIKGIV